MTSTPATKEHPFVNSLGMKFVPVPVADGPSKDTKVLFSVWETRRQDYAAYAEANPGVDRSWKNVEVNGHPMGQKDDHPVVHISCEDAFAFCKWLTEIERKGGKIPADAEYRLPSDHEWSCAVGIGNREDVQELAFQKRMKLMGVYPWGTEWPPPPGAGNYAGSECEGKFGIGADPIKGYKDGFIMTAPVGSFAANSYGLFDLSGNADEWCEDKKMASAAKAGGELLSGRALNPKSGIVEQVQRGGSWGSNDPGTLLSCSRILVFTNVRRGGFRCVLVMSSL